MTTTTDNDGKVYPDCLSVPLEKFRYQKNPSSARLTQVNIDRFDLYIFDKYQSTNYLDIVLWLNNIGSIRELKAGMWITLPDKSDLDTFHIKYRTN